MFCMRGEVGRGLVGQAVVKLATLVGEVEKEDDGGDRREEGGGHFKIHSVLYGWVGKEGVKEIVNLGIDLEQYGSSHPATASREKPKREGLKQARSYL